MGRDEWEFEMSRWKLLQKEWRNSKVLLHSLGNSSQYPAIDHNEKEYEREYEYKCTTESLHCVAEFKTACESTTLE